MNNSELNYKTCWRAVCPSKPLGGFHCGYYPHLQLLMKFTMGGIFYLKIVWGMFLRELKFSFR